MNFESKKKRGCPNALSDFPCNESRIPCKWVVETLRRRSEAIPLVRPVGLEPTQAINPTDFESVPYSIPTRTRRQFVQRRMPATGVIDQIRTGATTVTELCANRYTTTTISGLTTRDTQMLFSCQKTFEDGVRFELTKPVRAFPISSRTQSTGLCQPPRLIVLIRRGQCFSYRNPYDCIS
jgi:hypothetical protein